MDASRIRETLTVAATAQETYRDMIKNQVAPGLRRLGFKGSGRNYQLPSDDYWALLGFQKSEHSDSTRIYFTTNLLVVSRAVWERERKQTSYMPVRPTANISWGHFAWWHRLGALVEGGDEIWWEVEAGMGTDELAGAVLWAVEDYALPAMVQQMR